MFAFLLIIAVAHANKLLDIVQTDYTNEIPVVFHKYEYNKCYQWGVLGSIKFVKKEDTVTKVKYYKDDCSGDNFETPVEYSNSTLGYKDVEKDPDHIAFRNSYVDADCTKKDNVERMYYAENVFVMDNEYYRYDVEEIHHKSDYFFMYRCLDGAACKQYEVVQTIGECHKCPSTHQYLECASAPLLVLLTLTLFLLLI